MMLENLLRAGRGSFWAGMYLTHNTTYREQQQDPWTAPGLRGADARGRAPSLPAPCRFFLQQAVLLPAPKYYRLLVG
jgi:hypothetical protein